MLHLVPMASSDPWRAYSLPMETVPCDVCGSTEFEGVRDLSDLMHGTTPRAFRLVRCRRCDLLFLNPRPRPEAISQLYPADYAPFARRGLAARVKAARMRREVRELWPLLTPPARVMDLGCATGDLLQAIRARGNPHVIGIEPSPAAAKIARGRWGLDVRVGDLTTACLEDASGDVALLAHVIEHLPSPAATLDELRRVLTPHGALVLWLPNADSLAARWLGSSWMGWDAPRHLYAFTPRTIAALLDRHGFVVRQVRHEWIGLEFSWGLRLLARQRWGRGGVDRALGRLHPALTAAFTPLALLAAFARLSGRIRVVAFRRIE